MKAGGSVAKGSSFERDTCRVFSLWVSAGARADLFSRNVLSGGRFTNQAKANSAELSNPGDMIASHPMGNAFLSLFAIECKHVQNVGFEPLLFDFAEGSFLTRVLGKARTQAHMIACQPLVVARQNRRPTVLFVDARVGNVFLGACPPKLKPRYHILHSGRTMLFDFEQTLACCKWERVQFIAEATRSGGRWI